ncbi:hypothetical protein [uncultured Alistipes sp.]|uniref:hypothetical protein n=1 Tax=uncultured Alistipes sp. TaxID=538949 RepID=UPI0026174DFC|nr:hypothetical protein [uncultured Alistipes sp.]
MNRIEIPEAGIVVEVPASYAEMTRPQLFYVMRQLDALQQGRISLAECRVRILYKLAGIKRTARSIAWERLHPAAARRRAEQVALMADRLLGFLFTTDAGKLLPAFDCLENHMPALRIGRRRFIGPADGLMDVSVGEMMAADAELALYAETKDARHIDNMLATLYRRPGPRQPSGRRVAPLDIDRTERAARAFRSVPSWKKQLFLLWYTACIDNLQRGTFTINGRGVSFASLFDSKKPSGQSLGWLGTVFNLAERKTFGGMKETSDTNVVDVLLLLLNDQYNAENARKDHKAD